MDWLADPQNFTREPGSLFVGRDPNHLNREVGVSTERHAITIAGAGAGKGACVIIPNLQRWEHNALVIDPKGEAANATWQIREEMGQAVHVLDPFNVADQVPQRLKARVNILDELDANSPTIREDIGVITDGLVKRADDRAAFWDDGGKMVLAGLLAMIIDQATSEDRNLPIIRDTLFELGNDPEGVIEALADNNSCGNLPAAAAQRLRTGGNEVKSFLQVANTNTDWLDSGSMKEILSSSTFRLSDLKTKPCTVFLVLPPQYLNEHGRFLRLFVRMALNTMAKGGLQGRRCLFLLDEFFALGHIDEIEKAAGLMRGYGVQLWPILQNLGQLVQLYGQDGAHTFFANADLHQFFGISDQPTLQYASALSGETTVEEIGNAPTAPIQKQIGGPGLIDAMSGMSNNKSTQMMGNAMSAFANSIEANLQAGAQARYQDEMNAFQQSMSLVGRPRITIEKMADLLAKHGQPVAPLMFCLINGNNRMLVKSSPHFQYGTPQEQAQIRDEEDRRIALEAQRKRELEGPTAHPIFPVAYYIALIVLWYQSIVIGDSFLTKIMQSGTVNTTALVTAWVWWVCGFIAMDYVFADHLPRGMQRGRIIKVSRISWAVLFALASLFLAATSISYLPRVLALATFFLEHGAGDLIAALTIEALPHIGLGLALFGGAGFCAITAWNFWKFRNHSARVSAGWSAVYFGDFDKPSMNKLKKARTFNFQGLLISSALAAFLAYAFHPYVKTEVLVAMTGIVFFAMAWDLDIFKYQYNGKIRTFRLQPFIILMVTLAIAATVLHQV